MLTPKWSLRLPFHATSFGQSLTEYSLGMALVLAIAVPVIMLFGGNLKDLWQGFGGSLAVSHTKSNQLGLTGSLIKNGTVTANTVSIKTAKGNTITLENYLANPLGQSIATLGANGTTTVLADNLAQLAQKLLDSGDISKTQYNTLVQLSNQGHYMAEIAGVVEQAAQKYTNANSQDYFNATVMVDGQAVTMKQLLDTMGYIAVTDTGYRYYPSTGEVYNTLPTDLLNPSNGGGESISGLLTLYHKADASGALSDPAIKQIVSSLTTQIALAQESLEQAQGEVYMGNSSPGQLESMTASKAMNLDSSGICQAGNGADSGIHCSSL